MTNSIVDSMARTLWVSTYADWWDEAPDDVQAKYPGAGAGEDWMDVAPGGIPCDVEDQAWRLCGMIEQANGMALVCLAAAAHRAENEGDGCERSWHFDNDFGHCLAMMAMGTGVSWYDNHARFYLDSWSDEQKREMVVPAIDIAGELDMDECVDEVCPEVP